jgi:protein SCO1
MKSNIVCLCMMGLSLLRGAEPYRGGLVTPPLPKPGLVLTGTDGVRINLASETRGDVTLLFFGYTHCPDVCPMHMAYLASALKKLPAPVRGQIKLVFITTDPARDDPKTLRIWLDHFDRQFIGLTGSEAEIAAAQSAAHVPHAGKSGEGHAAFILAYTKDNLAHVIYPFGVSEADWLHDLPLLVREDWRLR